MVKNDERWDGELILFYVQLIVIIVITSVAHIPWARTEAEALVGMATFQAVARSVWNEQKLTIVFSLIQS